MRVGFWKQETDSLANSTSLAEVAKAKYNQQNMKFLMTVDRFYRCGRTISGRLGRAPTLGRVQIGLNMIHGPMGQK
jgi:hypothetical protein